MRVATVFALLFSSACARQNTQTAQAPDPGQSTPVYADGLVMVGTERIGGHFVTRFVDCDTRAVCYFYQGGLSCVTQQPPPDTIYHLSSLRVRAVVNDVCWGPG